MKTSTDETPMPISRFPVPNFDDLPDDLKAMMLAVQEKAGFIPVSYTHLTLPTILLV